MTLDDLEGWTAITRHCVIRIALCMWFRGQLHATKEHRHGLATGKCSQIAKDANFGNVNYWRLFSENCHQSGVGWLKSTILQFFRFYIFVSFRNKVDIIVHFDNSSFCWHQERWPWMTLNALFHLKCDFRTSCQMGRQTGVKQPKMVFFH